MTQNDQIKRVVAMGDLVLEKETGGGGGIRTLVPQKGVNGFRDRRIQPLCHPSAWGERRAIEEEGAPRESNWRRVRDLNPGDAFGAYTISNRAPSATRTTLRVQHRKLYRIFPTMQTGILCSSYKRGEEGAVTGWWMLDGELIGGSAARGRADSADRLARLVQAWAAIRARYATRRHLA